MPAMIVRIAHRDGLLPRILRRRRVWVYLVADLHLRRAERKAGDNVVKTQSRITCDLLEHEQFAWVAFFRRVAVKNRADRGVICAVQALQVVLVRVFLRELPAIRSK